MAPMVDFPFLFKTFKTVVVANHLKERKKERKRRTFSIQVGHPWDIASHGIYIEKHSA